ncbi:hypothetical protein [Methylobacterium nodulans]|uniref:Uncharacterized protein n=1 Tax=Methylobacterium nodulans (strain LMG 21967 / CNCM I-2342 / ORS 2060) TaxID=460265 RepID=B8IY03_METNO|nr:hypothetical protein [Methylobacterium nodulans]ACL63293.1 hypothetical protein Mnod_7699 [Methylobacterium nodulans ORS 2060]
MHSDLARARQMWEQHKEVVQRLENNEPQQGESPQQLEAALHTARLRSYIALGRVIALEQSYHAHQAGEGAPINYWQQG